MVRPKVSELTWVAVTTVARVVNPGEGLLYWANKVGREGKTIQQARSSGTDNGKALHRVVERICAGSDPEEVRLTTPAGFPLSGFVGGLVRWWQDNDVQPLHSEADVSSTKLMVRGRVDLVRKCDVSGCLCHGDGAVLTDFKTGGHRVYREAHIQGDGYREIWPYTGLLPRHLCAVEFVTLSATETPTYQVHPLLAERGTFLRALALWRAVDALDSAINRLAAA